MKIISVGANAANLAPDRVIEALFLTIGCRLEPGGRGSKFPAVMNHLESGYLLPKHAPDVLRELQEIEEALRKTPVSGVFWDPTAATGRVDDTNEPVNHRAANVLEYFVDFNGQTLITRLREGVQECDRTATVLRIRPPDEAGEIRKVIAYSLFLALLGVGWMWLGHALFPTWVVAKAYSPGSAIHVWTFGMLLVMIGFVLAIVAFPRSRAACGRHPLWFFAGVVLAIIGWLVAFSRAGWL